ncbi:methyltransferase family protein [Clostridium intestinale]|uniref:Isoprenylcysteine carboxyl methyltransferase n=1 Tax=Clostridium intestinale URNW TaxID=1294142 RepID=U2N0J0_9CLOT|nr:isoprenylcysteine carboxylmethyltransferase family protein [Clostridium intestinale]ERK29012.1 isoprenylcysteine carboxyl methyltransferase [Clostridium intestinale URNW]
MKTKNNLIKGTFWGAALFYFLIAFEFFYMAGPFAAYFYSVYAPALNFFNDIPILSWLNSFFLPHAVRETSSIIINSHEVIGAILAIGGFIAFSIGACQVYYNKLTKKGVVTGGIYNFVRHPQYISFIICSLGLLILWPRYIVLIMFITMIFAYYMLAKIEERECIAKFGQSYIDYKNRTNMFLPFSLNPFPKFKFPKTIRKKIMILASIYLAVLLISIGLAKGLQILSINSLYSVYTENSADISVCELSDKKINSIMEIIRSDSKVVSILSDFDESTQYVNYILPTEWFAAEIPMKGLKLGQGHLSPGDYDTNLFKIIITKVIIKGNNVVPSTNFLNNIYRRDAIAEIWINFSEQKVTQILDMPENIRYDGVPVAVY